MPETLYGPMERMCTSHLFMTGKKFNNWIVVAYQGLLVCHLLSVIDNPLQYSCLENPMDGGAWWATVHGVAKSRI